MGGTAVWTDRESIIVTAAAAAADADDYYDNSSYTILHVCTSTAHSLNAV